MSIIDIMMTLRGQRACATCRDVQWSPLQSGSTIDQTATPSRFDQLTLYADDGGVFHYRPDNRQPRTWLRKLAYDWSLR
jgi:hypothetical protein